MIVVTFGTIFFPFDRAVSWLQVLLEQEVIIEPVLVQCGATSADTLNHHLVTKVISLTPHEMRDAVEQASLVISHAGQGSTRMLAEMGASFVLLPRLKRYGEHVDDHQLSFARTVERFGVSYCTELEQLAYYVKQRPVPSRGEWLKAPLLVDHLMKQYGTLELPAHVRAHAKV